MTVVINGSLGIQNPLGSASAPSESNTTNSNTGAYFPTGTTYAVATAGTNALYIDASQNVGIGTTSPGSKLDVNGQITVRSTLAVYSSGASNLLVRYANSINRIDSYNDPITATTPLQFDASQYTFLIADAEKMRLDSSGNLLVGTTTASYSGKVTSSVGASNSAYSAIFSGSGGSAIGYRSDFTGTTGTAYAMYFTYNGVASGAITNTSGATTYATSSDYRLKENVVPLASGLATISAIKPVTYDWIANKEKGEGFIAHELQTVIPLAVIGEKDAVDEKGKIKPQGVDPGKIIPHLVAALQELSAEVTALKAKIGA